MTDQETAPTVYTVEEVSTLLRISRSKLYELVADGAIPSLRLGRAVRIPRAAVEELLHIAVDDNQHAASGPGGGPDKTLLKDGGE